MYTSGVPTVGIRHLRADVAALVRRAATGETITVTVAGRPAARLGPVDATSPGEDMDRLVALGLVDAPRRRGPWRPPAPVAVWNASRIDKVLGEIRG